MAPAHRPVHFGLWLGLAWALAAALLLAWRWADLGGRLFDADDAMRLVQVREFLAGRGWFDLYEPRIDPPTGYDGHWSRLIDLGLAGLLVAARPFTDAAGAEVFMRVVWPLLWLLVAIGATAALAWRIAGRNSGLLALVVAACAVPAFQHFKPGTIDHHNVQVALAMAIVAAAAWSDRKRGAATLAGILTGLALAVGLENIFFVALGGAAIVLRFVADGRSGETLTRYALSAIAALCITFMFTVAPMHWNYIACDALALNWLAPALVALIGFGAAGRMLAESSVTTRAIAVAAVCAIALAIFVTMEPRCLRGPFALADDAIRAIWLDKVDETEPLMQFIRGYPMMAIWLCAAPFVSVLAAVILAGDSAMRRDSAFLLAVSALAISIGATLAAVKVYSYAMWFGMPLVAAAASRITLASGVRAAAVRFSVALICAPPIVTVVGMLIAQAMAAPDVLKPGIAERVACTTNDAYKVLAHVPKGLVATDVNYGSYALALTSHDVLAAPYHRLRDGIVDAYTIFHGTPSQAYAALMRRKVDYVAVCGTRPPTPEVPPPGSLWSEINEGHVPSWLERVPGDAAVVVYRVRRDGPR